MEEMGTQAGGALIGGGQYCRYCKVNPFTCTIR